MFNCVEITSYEEVYVIFFNYYIRGFDKFLNYFKKKMFILFNNFKKRNRCYYYSYIFNIVNFMRVVFLGKYIIIFYYSERCRI